MSALGLSELMLIPNIGLTELLVILLIVVLIFGAGRLPQLGRGIGEGIRNFKDSLRGAAEDEKKKD